MPGLVHGPVAGKILMALLVLAAIGAAFGANMWKRDLSVTKIRTRGNVIVQREEILKLAAIETNARVFDVDLDAVQRRVAKNPFVRAVAVTRDVPDGIIIEVDERKPVAALALDRLLLIDGEGVVLPPVRSDAVFDLPVINGVVSAAGCVPGKTVRSAAVRDALLLLDLAGRIGEESQQRISEVHLRSDGTMLVYTAEYGVPVIIGRDDLAEKLVIFDGFWREIVNHRGAQDLQYVDLRFDDRVVARWK